MSPDRPLADFVELCDALPPFVALRAQFYMDPPDWFDWWYAFTMGSSCIAENEL